MTEKLQGLMYSLLKGKSFSSNSELYLFLTLHAAVGFAWLVYAFMILFFLSAWLPVFALLGTASLCLNTICFLLIRRGRYCSGALLLTGTVSTFTLLCAFLMRGDTYVVLYIYVILLMQVTIPYGRRALRGAMVFLLWVISILCVMANFIYLPMAPAIDVPWVFAAFNMHVGFLGVAIQLSISNVIRGVIDRYNDMLLESYKTQANLDPLTQLYNRRYSEAFFDRIRREGITNYFAALMDIDDFSQINNDFGHGAGDIVLRAVADIMRETLRKTDILIRWGGEEFLLLLFDVDYADSARILDKLRLAIFHARIPISPAGEEIPPVTVTIGTAPLDPKNIDESLALCDERLYEGKHSGKNKIVGSSQLTITNY